MGIFDKLFGNKKKSVSDSSLSQELRLEYNVMNNISLEKSNKYENSELYRFVETGIYQDLKDEDESSFRITLSYELESDDSNNQYPLDDVLNKYFLHVSDFYESENNPDSNKYKLELAGDLEDVKNLKEIIGKRIFNRDFLKNGQVRVDLIIE